MDHNITITESGKKVLKDITDETDLFVYYYKSNTSEIISKAKLVERLEHLEGSEDSNGTFRLSTTAIRPWTSKVEIVGNDLILKDERRNEDNEDPINGSSLTATVGIPWNVRVKRGIFGKHKKLYIVSPYTSAKTTPENSERSSRRSTGEI